MNRTLGMIALGLLGAGMAQPVQAASATSYGAVKVTHVIASNAENARQSALSACSSADSNCAIISQCEENGFGAAAVSRTRGWVESIGAICGQPDLNAAMREAIRLCGVHAAKGTCMVEQVWQDR